MTDVAPMVQRPLPGGLVMYNLTQNGAVLSNASRLADAIARNGFSQAVRNNAYTPEIIRYWPPALQRNVSQTHVGFKDQSQNDNSEFTLGMTMVYKRFPPPDSFERTYTEATSVFISNVDKECGNTLMSVPVHNIFQHRRSVLMQLNNASNVQRAAQHVDDSFMHAMATDSASTFNFGSRNERTQDEARSLVNMSQSRAAQLYEQSLVSGTGNILELTSSSAQEFAMKNNYVGPIIKHEPNNGTQDPCCAISVAHIAEKRERNLFGRPMTNDYCYFLVKKWERAGLFRTAAMCGGEFSGLSQTDLLQVRGFCTNDMPHTMSGADSEILHSDTYYVDKENEMATVHRTRLEWDEERGTFKESTAEDRADSLDRLSQVVYDAYLMPGKIYPVGQYKGRFATQDAPEKQLLATMSPDCYNQLEPIFLYNMLRNYH